MAYRLDTLERLWTAAMESTQLNPLPVACGPVLCRFGPAGGVQAIDPRTCQAYWSDPRWSVATSAGGYLVSTGPDRTGPGSRPDLAVGG